MLNNLQQLQNIMDGRLRGESMDRLISEKAVLEAFREYQGSISDFYKAVKAIPSAEPKAEQFAKWVASEIFDEMWEYNQDAFVEIACRKLSKLGIVVRMGDEWMLVEEQESEE